MKTVFFVRHAESEGNFGELTDFERPLTSKGKAEASKMANILLERHIKPDAMFSSPALRTYYTARIFANVLNFPKANLVCKENLYDASPSDYIDIVEDLPEGFSNVFIFGHNPVITSVCTLLGDKRINNIPTAGVVAIEFPHDSWEEIDLNSGKIKFFEFPKSTNQTGV